MGFLFFLTFGCATRYEPYGGWGGYKDKEISSGVHEISFLGNGATSFEKVKEFWHRRASDLCINGYVVKSLNNKISSTTTTGAMIRTAAIPISISYPQLQGVVECKDSKNNSNKQSQQDSPDGSPLL